MTEKELIDSIAFVYTEFVDNPIKNGPLKGEFNVSLAKEKMLEIGHLLKEYHLTTKLTKPHPEV